MPIIHYEGEPPKKPLHERVWERITGQGERRQRVRRHLEAQPGPDEPIAPQAVPLQPEIRRELSPEVQQFEQRPTEQTTQAQQQPSEDQRKEPQPQEQSVMQLWEQLRAEKERQKQEAAEQAKTQQRQQQLAELRRQQEMTEKQAMAEQEKKIEAERGEQSCKELAEEVRKLGIPLDQLAEQIKNAWESTQQVSVDFEEISDPAVTLNDDETIKTDRSRYRVKLSFSYEDLVLTETRSDAGESGSEWIKSGSIETLKKELSFGIGKFGVSPHMIHTGYIGDNRDKGVTAMFIEHSHPPEIRDERIGHYKYDSRIKGSMYVYSTETVVTPSAHTDNTVIPLAYSDKEQVIEAFVNNLFNIAENISPNMLIPDATTRVQTYRREHGTP